jgi:hypothetical protein
MRRFVSASVLTLALTVLPLAPAHSRGGVGFRAGGVGVTVLHRGGLHAVRIARRFRGLRDGRHASGNGPTADPGSDNNGGDGPGSGGGSDPGVVPGPSMGAPRGDMSYPLDEHGYPYNARAEICFWQRGSGGESHAGFVRICR